MEENKLNLDENSKEDTSSNKDEVKVEASSNNEDANKDLSTGKKVLNFFITTLNGMAYGLFATLIIGTIIGTIGGFFSKDANDFTKFMYETLTFTGNKCLAQLTGAGIGVGVAIALKKKPLEVVVLGAVGELTAWFSLSTKFVTTNVINSAAAQIGDPLTIYITVISVAVLMGLVFRKKTPVDILIISLFAITVGLTVGLLVRFPAIYVTYAIQWLVNAGTSTVPFVMGIIVAVLMGMALTAPISSAAIAAMVFTLPEGITIAEALASTDYRGLVIASGAAAVGCSCQMIGFAIQSRKDNSIGIVISIGIGTSMLQFKNILKKPIVWLPTIIASAILGPISTCFLELVCQGSAAGMGTSGLVGQIGTFASMGNTWQTWVGIFGLQIALPMALVFGIDLLFRKLGLIKEGDLKV